MRSGTKLGQFLRVFLPTLFYVYTESIVVFSPALCCNDIFLLAG